MVYPYIVIQNSNRNGQSTNIPNSIDESCKQNVQENKPDTKECT